jgi:hypothetical protein
MIQKEPRIFFAGHVIVVKKTASGADLFAAVHSRQIPCGPGPETTELREASREGILR